MRVSTDHLVRTCDDIIYFAERVRADAGALEARARDDSRDGLPTSSGIAGGGGRAATDRDGEALPDYSDPTGDQASAAADGDPGDEVRAASQSLLVALKKARASMQIAELSRGEVLPGKFDDVKVDDEGDVVVELDSRRRAGAVCANRNCEDLAELRRAGRCSACCEYLRRTGRDAPPAVVTKRLADREAALHKARLRVVGGAATVEIPVGGEVSARAA